MVPTLIVLGLLALGVGIVAFATRRPPAPIDNARADNDTVWKDPAAPVDPAPVQEDPFAHAPLPAAADAVEQEQPVQAERA